MKVYERVLEKRLRQQVVIGSMQFGFMLGKGTTDTIFTVRQLQEKHLSKRKELYFGFVNLEKAFNQVPREVVRWALRKAGVEEWLVRAVMALFVDARTFVQMASGDSESFKVKVGVHQGSVLSPLLFIIVMDVLSREASEGLPWEVLFADDMALMAESEQGLMLKLRAWRTAMERKGLKVNAGKSKVMVSAIDAGEMEETGEYPCGVCCKGVGANSTQCTTCAKWVHRRCSGIAGSLQG